MFHWPVEGSNRGTLVGAFMCACVCVRVRVADLWKNT